MEQQLLSKGVHEYDTWSSSLVNVEISDDSTRAILTIPLMHVGPNNKGLYWTEEVLEKIVPLYQGIPFRYDLGGQEGSSHTTNKLSSPHFDVGWTYEGNNGAWYDSKTKSLWVCGEVTHPEVISKLKRTTSDGKKEVNFASMGAIVDEAICSICKKDFEECDHERNKPYNGKIAYKVPTVVSKGLHVALTNDPADGEAEIKECIFQELGGSYQMSPNDLKQPASNQMMETTQALGSIPGGLAASSPLSGRPGAAPSPEAILRDLAERIKTIENRVYSERTETPELVNAAPQDRMSQDNMGVTSQIDKTEEGGKNMGKEQVGQVSNAKTEVNPKSPEMQEGNMVQQTAQPQPSIADVMSLLQQILQKLSGNTEVQDMGKESMDASKSQAVDHHNPKVAPVEHEQPGESVANDTDESNKKNKAGMTKQGGETADNSEVSKLKKEVADMKEGMSKLRSKLEIQDGDLPEFGGAAKTNIVEVANMGADKRSSEFGDYGKWDACFNGADSARKFKR